MVLLYLKRRKIKMNKQDLIKILEKSEIEKIEIEDYNGNTILTLDFNMFDIADIEGKTLRLQLNEDKL